MKTYARWLLVAALAAPTLALHAQAVSNASGTIEEFMIDEGYMVVDGKRVAIREADLVITYKGETIRPSLVSPGLTIFYSTRADGTVSEITLIGPVTRLEQIDNQ